MKPVSRIVARLLLVTLACGLIAPARVNGAQDPGDDATRHFRQNVSAYLALRQRAVASIPQQRVTGSAARLERTEADLRRAIRAARPNARSGEIFSPDVAAAFRQRLTEITRQHGTTAAAQIAKIDDDTTRAQRRILEVNGHFVWNHGSEMPVVLLDGLPALRAPLEYVFVGGHLVLVDVDADLVVDILRDALRDE